MCTYIEYALDAQPWLQHLGTNYYYSKALCILYVCASSANIGILIHADMYMYTVPVFP